MLESLKEFFTITVLHTPSGLILTIGNIASVLVLIFVGYVISRIIEYVLAKRLAATKLGSDAVIAIKRISFYLIFVLIGFTIMGLLGIPLTAFAFATGAIAIGVGFGAQNIINNFISGWILIAERPIRLDDFIEIEGVFGTVERVGTRSTRIRRTDGVHMLVPNSKLLENTVTNWTLINHEIRTSVRLGVAYGSDINLVSELFLQAANENQSVKKEPVPTVVLDDFGDNAIVYECFFWSDVSGEKTLRETRSDIRFRVAELFAQNGIVIAFPQRDVHLDAAKPLAIEIINDKKTLQED